MARKTIHEEIQSNVLFKSRRRCCLCFWLKGEDEVKKGQLAHLDGNNENPNEDNLVFLCLEHHDEYDSTPRLSKGLRQREVKKWRDELYKEMEYRFCSITSGPLSISYDEKRHCYREDNKQCAIYRIAVRNEGQATINNIEIKIQDISCDLPSDAKNLLRLVGLRLSVSQNPTGPYSHPNDMPCSTVLLHPGDEVVFDFVRLCIFPGNFLVCHSNFSRVPQTSRIQQTPDGVLFPANYFISLAVQGDNLNSIIEQFEMSSTTSDILFRRIAVEVL